MHKAFERLLHHFGLEIAPRKGSGALEVRKIPQSFYPKEELFLSHLQDQGSIKQILLSLNLFGHHLLRDAFDEFLGQYTLEKSHELHQRYLQECRPLIYSQEESIGSE